MPPPGNTAQNNIPSLYTAVEITYKGERLQLNIHDLMSYLMQHPDMLLKPSQPIGALPVNNSTPQDWLSLDPTLLAIKVGGQTIAIGDNAYTSLQNFTQQIEAPIDTQVLDLLEDFILKLYHHSKNDHNPARPDGMAKNFLELWGSISKSEVRRNIQNSELNNASYFAFGDATRDTYAAQQQTMGEFIKAVQSKEFIHELVSNLEEKTKQIFDNLATRFKTAEQKDFFNHFRLGLESAIKTVSMQSFIQEAQQDAFDLNTFISDTLSNLEKKPTTRLSTINMHCYAAAQKMIPIFEAAQKANLLDNINDRDLIVEMRRLLRNPENTHFHFLPTLVATLFFSELHRRKNKDIAIATLSLLDLIQSGQKTPDGQDYYSFYNLVINHRERPFYSAYGNTYSGTRLKSIGFAPASHAHSYDQEMEKRAAYFTSMMKSISTRMCLQIEIVNHKYKSIGREIDKLKSQPASNDREAQLKLLKSEGSFLKNTLEKLESAKDSFLKKQHENLNKDLRLYLVEQKIAHLLLHWLSLQINDLNPVLLQLPEANFKKHTPLQEKLISDFLENKMMPLLKERLNHFNCMLPDHAEKVLQDTLNAAQNVIDDLANNTVVNYDSDSHNVASDNSFDLDDVYEDNENDDESLPSPFIHSMSLSSLTSSPVTPSLSLLQQAKVSEDQEKSDYYCTENKLNSLTN